MTEIFVVPELAEALCQIRPPLVTSSSGAAAHGQIPGCMAGPRLVGPLKDWLWRESGHESRGSEQSKMEDERMVAAAVEEAEETGQGERAEVEEEWE